LSAALNAYLLSFAANLVSAGVRLIPLGQTDGLRTIAALEPAITAVAREVGDLPLAELGGATIRADIAAMKHETQYTRLFRT
jgi:urease accessory protein